MNQWKDDEEEKNQQEKGKAPDMSAWDEAINRRKQAVQNDAETINTIDKTDLDVDLDEFDQDLEDYRKKREARAARMRQERQREKMRRQMIMKYTPIVAGAVAVVIILVVVLHFMGSSRKNESDLVAQTTQTTQDTAPADNTEEQSTEDTTSDLPATSKEQYHANMTENTEKLGKDIISKYAVLIDTSSQQIIAQKNAMKRMNPASMTKVLTVLVAAEQLSEEQMNDTVKITQEDTDFCYVNDLSNVGYCVGEKVPVKDLFYGTILCSGGDAAHALAVYTAGTQDKFVELMNDKLKELGIDDTAHMTNCAGLYDENHYCTAYDMALILQAAIQNDFCKQILSKHTYTTEKTKEHPDGICISNWFLRRIEDKDSGGTVVCAKTGYVAQSGNCAASYAQGPDGQTYICVTGKSTSGWNCIYDHVAIYKKYM